MIKVEVKRLGQLMHIAYFPVKEQAEAWASQEIKNGSFGKPATPDIVDEETGEIIEVGKAAEFDINFIEVSEDLKKEAAIVLSKKFLADTDWYILRATESGKAVPVNILNDRALAREKISQIENIGIYIQPESSTEPESKIESVVEEQAERPAKKKVRKKKEV